MEMDSLFSFLSLRWDICEPKIPTVKTEKSSCFLLFVSRKSMLRYTQRKIHGCSRLKAELKIQGFFFRTHYYFSPPLLLLPNLQLSCCRSLLPLCQKGKSKKNRTWKSYEKRE